MGMVFEGGEEEGDELDAEGGGGVNGAKRVGEGRVRRLVCIHELAHKEPLI